MMPLADLLSYAVRALTRHRVRSALCLLGMAIAVAAVIVLTALGEGTRRYVSSQFANIGTNLVMVSPGRTDTTGFLPGVAGAPHDLTLEDFQALVRDIREIDRGAPISTGTATVSYRERRRLVAVLGSTEALFGIRRLTLAQGSFLPDEDIHRAAPVAVIGSKIAQALFPGQDPIGEAVRIDEWRMRVIGVLAPRGYQLGMDMDDVVVIPVATAMEVFNRHSLFAVLLEGRTHRDLDVTCRGAVQVLRARHGDEDVTCTTQDAVVSTFSAILAALTLALVAIASVSLSVAGIGIMNVMLVSVSERTREVGILRAIGATRRQILLLFVTEAALLSAAGCVLGLAIGSLAIGLLVGAYPDLPASPPLWAVGAAFATCVVTGIMFGVWPASRAARLDPIVSLARR